MLFKRVGMQCKHKRFFWFKNSPHGMCLNCGKFGTVTKSEKQDEN